MKKAVRETIISVAIIFTVAVVIFFIGWTQLRIKSGHFGIMTSKTGGIDDEAIEYGDYSWHWEHLLPTNASLKVFQLTPYNLKKTSNGVLPGSDVFKNSFNQKLDFSYYLTFDFEINISQKNIIKLLKENVINNQDDLTDYVNKAADRFTETATSYILEEKEINFALKPELMTTEELCRISKIQMLYPMLEFKTVTVEKNLIPDFSLYNRIRNEYIKNIKYTDPIIIYADVVKPDPKSNQLKEAIKEVLRQETEKQNQKKNEETKEFLSNTSEKK